MRDVAEGLPISSVSTILEIPVPTIRSWERRYGIPAPERTAGGHRRYTEAEVEALREIRDGIVRGHTAREAVRLLLATPTVGRPRDAIVRAVVEAATRLDPTSLRRELDGALEGLGVEPAILEVALPAMREIGERWRLGTCDVAQEHLATDGVRAWLARLRAMAPAPFRRPAVLLACGPREDHSVGLEAFAVLLSRRGFPCRVLGPRTPVPSLVAAARRVRPAAVIVTAHRGVVRRPTVEALDALGRVRRIRRFYAGNGFMTASSRKGVRGTYLGDDLSEGLRTLESSLRTAA